MTGFHADPTAMAAFAEKCDGHGDELHSLLGQLHSAAVGRDSFGHIPQVGSKIYQAYDEHVDKCVEAVSGAEAAVHSVGANVALTALHYEQADKASTPP